MNASPAPTVSTTLIGGPAPGRPGRRRSRRPFAAVGEQDDLGALAVEQRPGDVLGVGAGCRMSTSWSLSLTRCARAASASTSRQACARILDERRPDVRVVADEHVAGPRLVDQVEHAVAAGLENRAERAHVQRVAVRQLLVRQAPSPGRSRTSPRRPIAAHRRGRGAPGRRGRGDQLGTRGLDALDDPPPALVAADLGDQHGRHVEPGQGDGDVQRASRRRSHAGRVGSVDDVDERLSDDDDHPGRLRSRCSRGQGIGSHGLAGPAQRSKSTSAYALSLLILCSLMICRIVPLRLRITREWVDAPPAR